jgi:hypothetical protein
MAAPPLTCDWHPSSEILIYDWLGIASAIQWFLTTASAWRSMDDPDRGTGKPAFEPF